MKLKIAVIGAGVFGCTLASELAGKGFQVDLFEKQGQILLGSTIKSVLRLHLGHHYPRSISTAVQSVEGFRSFKERFSDALEFSFNNYYAVAKVGSKVSSAEFRSFLIDAKLPHEEISVKSLADIGMKVSNLDSAFSAPEGVINAGVLREMLATDLAKNRVNVRYQTEITSARLTGTGWVLTGPNEGQIGPYDFVFRTTYSSDYIQVMAPELSERDMEFHRTLVVQARVSLGKVGVTVVDGDFLTALPLADTSDHLLYGPTPSVIERSYGDKPPQSWNQELPENELSLAEALVLARYKEWFDDPEVTVVDRLIGIRAVKARVGKTDSRPSEIRENYPRFFDITSGKIDHSLNLAREIGLQLQRQP